jgi:hypothetical protein
MVRSFKSCRNDEAAETPGIIRPGTLEKRNGETAPDYPA